MPEPLTATTIERGGTTFTIRRLLPEAQFDVFERHVRPNLGAIIESVGGDVAAVLKRIVPTFSEIGSITGEGSGAALLEALDEATIAGIVGTIGKALSGLPPDDLMALRDKLFDQVFFTNKMSPRAQKVTAAFGTAFKDRPFVEIYDLTVRAFCCNFGDSWSAIASLLGMAAETRIRACRIRQRKSVLRASHGRGDVHDGRASRARR